MNMWVLDLEKALTSVGMPGAGYLFRRASAAWLIARAALAQIASAGNDNESSFRKEGMNGR
jgi:hypothetical protein